MAAPHRLFTLLSIPLISLIVTSCTKVVSSSEMASRAVDAYCPYLPSRSFSTPVTVSGTGLYEYRVNGNGVATDGGVNLAIPSFSSAADRTFSITVNSRVYTVSSNLINSAGQKDVAAKLNALINADSSAGLFAYGTNSVTVTQVEGTNSPLVSAPVGLTVGATNPSPRPVRFAEIAVKDSTGAIVQCAETANDGSYQFQLAANSGSYTVELRARSSNAHNSAYILNNPTDNLQYAVTKTVDTAGNTSSLFLQARVHDRLLGGAFNVLDQLLKAQDYLRTQTANCDQPADPNYFSGCVPFVAAPLVRVYWTPGLSPGIYVNTTGSISFYLTGHRELYLQGGQNGNITSSDMDQFDNSVIIHEYGHFIEDIYGHPDSPGGSHNGDSVIDPRLAWGEGWANFFQAAVLGDPVYRDTYGTPDCTSACAGVYFNEPLDPAGTPAHDAPATAGEGNFREFSVARILWDVVKASGGTSKFAEIWRAMVVASSGMKAVSDPFKTMGRFHFIQTSFNDATSWASIRTNEQQSVGFSLFATPFATGQSSCATSPVTMSPTRRAGDNGSFATSDLLRSNDFYRFDHPGGALNLELFYAKDPANPVDLDLYLYRPKYMFGRASDMLLSSAFAGDGCPLSGSGSDESNPFRGQNGCPTVPAGLTSTFGYEKGAGYLAAGTYMINIQADTSVRAGAPTTYVLLLNGQTVCPQP